jgi:Carbamoyl-phosphate synthase small chain, CPSase domain
MDENGVLKNFESARIHVAGLIVADYSGTVSQCVFFFRVCLCGVVVCLCVCLFSYLFGGCHLLVCLFQYLKPHVSFSLLCWSPLNTESFSHWNAVQSLGAWLKENNIPALCHVDTRAIIKQIRDNGTCVCVCVCVCL